ncbi:C-C motif chemokine 25 [Macrotis lagotis]|uniref:C-C motif chemokine 25 n=1 Tax=Macrotis lagotis TaxID=92651 RepID=UPI003D688934
MNLQLLTYLLVALVSAVSSQGSYEDCCLKYSKSPKLTRLRNIRHYKVQGVNGSCNLRAVVFELRKKNHICGNPEEKWVRNIIKYLESKASHHFMKSQKESKKDHGGSITNTTRPLTQSVQPRQMHGIGRNHHGAGMH